MRALIVALLLSVMFTACAHRQHTQALVRVLPERAITQSEAISIVKAEIRRHGGDPDKLEYSASQIDWHALEAELSASIGQELPAISHSEEWAVTATGIYYDESGAKRSFPGGFTDYYLSADGKILTVRGGR